jgi:hypothetical protein
MLGIGDGDEEKIVYRERSKLVLPPAGRGLPEPRARDGERPASWPTNQEISPSAGEETSAQEAAAADCVAGAPDGKCAVEKETEGSLLGWLKSSSPNDRATAKRSHLTEPPSAYRQRVAGGKGVTEPEKSDWWSPGALIGKVFGD